MKIDMDRKTSWKQTLDKITDFYKQYSAKDVASSLFISSLWLPNNGSTIKHLLLTTLFAAQQPNVFSETDKITSYSEFKKFCEELYKLTPSFPSLEDYIPNYDWGTVKFHHQSENYKIFYGTEISHIYDFLVAFQFIYTPFDEEYVTLSGRSPSLELKQCLSFQDKIIEGVTTQPNEEKMAKVELGHIEVAPKKFWLQVSSLFIDLSSTDISDLSGKDEFVAELGTIKPEVLNLDVFGDYAFEGTLLSTYFISDGDSHFPVLPRRYSGILIEKWSKIFSKHGANIKKEKLDYQEAISLKVANFLEQRFHEGRFFPVVSALHPDNKPHELLFAGYILSEDKLVLIYVVKPYSSKKEIEKELEELKPKLQEALSLISKEPITLGLHTKRKTVVYESTVPDKKLKVELFVVLPQATTKIIPVAASKDFPGDIVFIDQFLGVMDEIERHEEVSEFIDYLRDVEGKINVPVTTLLDKFGSFRDSLGVLIPGANEPNMVMIDLQWGNDFRYKSLKSFWELYPESKFLDHPRSWKVKQETPTRVRLSAKNILGCVIHTKILNTGIFITSPLDLQEYEQGSMSNLLMECLEDYLSRYNDLISNHRFFKRYKSLDVVIFPNVLLEGNSLAHIKHLDPESNYWKSDRGFPQSGHPGIRLVYNHDKLREVFKDSTANDVEIDFLKEILSKMDELFPDPDFEKYLAELEKERGKKPRFKTIHKSKGVAFPEFISPKKPTLHDHKLSRKTEAQIALALGIKPGKYKLDRAKKIMNELRQVMVKELDKEISQYCYEDNIKYLITRIDALINDFVVEKIRLEESLKHEVDFVREEHYSKAHEEFLGHHKDYRYLLEKFVQLAPKGTKHLDDKAFRYLVAMVDKIYEIYSASDNLNYEIYTVGLTIDRDFLFRVQYKDDLDAMQQRYSQDQARIELGSDGNEDDRADSTIPIEEHLEQLDEAFKKDFGFGLRDTVSVLQVMSLWPGYMKDVLEAPYYSATKEEITEAAEKAIKGFDKSGIDKLLDFLTLKQEGMLTILGSSKPADDLPVWEHQKRPFRYAIKPLFFMNGKYLWGPHSVERSGRIWMGVSSNGFLPADLPASNVNSVLRANQVAVEKSLENKAIEISKRHTTFAERVNYGRGTHDQSLGEYDALVYLPTKNILLNIECKDIIGAYCLKDAKRIRDRIFRSEYEKGRKVKNPGNLLKVEKREEWLKNNVTKFATVLKWPIKKNPRVISIYVTRMDYWWTKFPPRATSVQFMRVDFLDEYIRDLLN